MELDLSPQVYYLDYKNKYPDHPVVERGKSLNCKLKNGKLTREDNHYYFGPIKKVKESKLPSDTEMVVVVVNATTAYECQTKIFS